MQVCIQPAIKFRLTADTMAYTEMYKDTDSSPNHRLPRSLTRRLKLTKHGKFILLGIINKGHDKLKRCLSSETPERTYMYT
jgi:hypothetical protein